MTENAIPTAVQEIPGPLRFSVRGQSFQLDLLETIYDLHDIAQEAAKQKLDHRAYLTRVIEHLHTQTGVLLTYGEADWLNDQLEIEFARAKKKQREAIAAALNWPSSTPSTPAD